MPLISAIRGILQLFHRMSVSCCSVPATLVPDRDLVVGVTVVVDILQKEVLVGAVAGESNGGNAEAREDALEAVEAAERTGVSPSLTGETVSTCAIASPAAVEVVLASPGVLLGPR